jgi:hypothetical protein
MLIISLFSLILLSGFILISLCTFVTASSSGSCAVKNSLVSLGSNGQYRGISGHLESGLSSDNAILGFHVGLWVKVDKSSLSTSNNNYLLTLGQADHRVAVPWAMLRIYLQYQSSDYFLSVDLDDSTGQSVTTHPVKPLLNFNNKWFYLTVYHSYNYPQAPNNGESALGITLNDATIPANVFSRGDIKGYYYFPATKTFFVAGAMRSKLADQSPFQSSPPLADLYEGVFPGALADITIFRDRFLAAEAISQYYYGAEDYSPAGMILQLKFQNFNNPSYDSALVHNINRTFSISQGQSALFQAGPALALSYCHRAVSCTAEQGYINFPRADTGASTDRTSQPIITAEFSQSFVNQSFIWSFWARPAAEQFLSTGRIVTIGDFTSPSFYFVEFRGATNKFAFRAQASSCQPIATDFSADSTTSQPNHWILVSGAVDNSGNRHLFLNGQPAGRTTCSGLPWPISSGQSVMIGASPAPGSFPLLSANSQFVGALDEVIILFSPNLDDGQSIGTALQAYYSGKEELVSFATINGALPQLFYKFDEVDRKNWAAGVVWDNSGAGNHGQLSNAQLFDYMVQNEGADNTNSFLRISNPAALDNQRLVALLLQPITAKSFSFSFWAKPAAGLFSSGNNTIVLAIGASAQHSVNNSQSMAVIGFGGNQNLVFSIKGNGFSIPSYNSGLFRAVPQLNSNNWLLISGSLNASTGKKFLYINGQNYYESSTGDIALILSPARTVWIGYEPSAAGNSGFAPASQYNGDLDEIQLLSGIITADQALAYYVQRHEYNLSPSIKQILFFPIDEADIATNYVHDHSGNKNHAKKMGLTLSKIGIVDNSPHALACKPVIQNSNFDWEAPDLAYALTNSAPDKGHDHYLQFLGNSAGFEVFLGSGIWASLSNQPNQFPCAVGANGGFACTNNYALFSFYVRVDVYAAPNQLFHGLLSLGGIYYYDAAPVPANTFNCMYNVSGSTITCFYSPFDPVSSINYAYSSVDSHTFPNRWHLIQIALAFDSSTTSTSIYIDGQLGSNNDTVLNGVLTSMESYSPYIPIEQWISLGQIKAFSASPYPTYQAGAHLVGAVDEFVIYRSSNAAFNRSILSSYYSSSESYIMSGVPLDAANYFYLPITSADYILSQQKQIIRDYSQFRRGIIEISEDSVFVKASTDHLHNETLLFGCVEGPSSNSINGGFKIDLPAAFPDTKNWMLNVWFYYGVSSAHPQQAILTFGNLGAVSLHVELDTSNSTLTAYYWNNGITDSMSITAPPAYSWNLLTIYAHDSYRYVANLPVFVNDIYINAVYAGTITQLQWLGALPTRLLLGETILAGLTQSNYFLGEMDEVSLLALDSFYYHPSPYNVSATNIYNYFHYSSPYPPQYLDIATNADVFLVNLPINLADSFSASYPNYPDCSIRTTLHTNHKIQKMHEYSLNYYSTNFNTSFTANNISVDPVAATVRGNFVNLTMYTDGITLSTYFYRRLLTRPNTIFSLVAVNSTGIQHFVPGQQFSVTANADRLQFTGLDNFQSAPGVNFNQWNLLTIVLKPSSLVLYVNGLQFGRYNLSGPIVYPAGLESFVILGAQLSAQAATYINYFVGSIDEFQIFSSPVSAAQVANYWLSGDYLLSPIAQLMWIPVDCPLDTQHSTDYSYYLASTLADRTFLTQPAADTTNGFVTVSRPVAHPTWLQSSIISVLALPGAGFTPTGAPNPTIYASVTVIGNTTGLPPIASMATSFLTAQSSQGDNYFIIAGNMDSNHYISADAVNWQAVSLPGGSGLSYFPRQRVGLAVNSSRIPNDLWSVAGDNSTTFFNDVWLAKNVSDPLANLPWAQLTSNSALPPHYGFCVVVFHGVLYLFGGYTDPNSISTSLISAAYYSYNGISWTPMTVTGSFTPRYAHKCLVDEVDDVIFISGGANIVGSWNAQIIYTAFNGATGLITGVFLTKVTATALPYQCFNRISLSLPIFFYVTPNAAWSHDNVAARQISFYGESKVIANLNWTNSICASVNKTVYVISGGLTYQIEIPDVVDVDDPVTTFTANTRAQLYTRLSGIDFSQAWTTTTWFKYDCSSRSKQALFSMGQLENTCFDPQQANCFFLELDCLENGIVFGFTVGPYSTQPGGANFTTRWPDSTPIAGDLSLPPHSQWNYLAVTYTRFNATVGDYSLFINGILRFTIHHDAVNLPPPIVNGNSILWLGNVPTLHTRPNHHQFRGLFDDFALFANIALDSMQIFQIYTGTAPPPPAALFSLNSFLSNTSNYPSALLNSAARSSSDFSFLNQQIARIECISFTNNRNVPGWSGSFSALCTQLQAANYRARLLLNPPAAAGNSSSTRSSRIYQDVAGFIAGHRYELLFDVDVTALSPAGSCTDSLYVVATISSATTDEIPLYEMISEPFMKSQVNQPAVTQSVISQPFKAGPSQMPWAQSHYFTASSMPHSSPSTSYRVSLKAFAYGCSSTASVFVDDIKLVDHGPNKAELVCVEPSYLSLRNPIPNDILNTGGNYISIRGVLAWSEVVAASDAYTISVYFRVPSSLYSLTIPAPMSVLEFGDVGNAAQRLELHLLHCTLSCILQLSLHNFNLTTSSLLYDYWYNVQIVHTNASSPTGRLDLYLNARLAGSLNSIAAFQPFSSYPNATGASIVAADLFLGFGLNPTNTLATRFASVDIDEFALFNSALTQQTFTDYYGKLINFDSFPAKPLIWYTFDQQYNKIQDSKLTNFGSADLGQLTAGPQQFIAAQDNFAVCHDSISCSFSISTVDPISLSTSSLTCRVKDNLAGACSSASSSIRIFNRIAPDITNSAIGTNFNGLHLATGTNFYLSSFSFSLWLKLSETSLGYDFPGYSLQPQIIAHLGNNVASEIDLTEYVLAFLYDTRSLGCGLLPDVNQIAFIALNDQQLTNWLFVTCSFNHNSLETQILINSGDYSSVTTTASSFSFAAPLFANYFNLGAAIKYRSTLAIVGDYYYPVLDAEISDVYLYSLIPSMNNLYLYYNSYADMPQVGLVAHLDFSAKYWGNDATGNQYITNQANSSQAAQVCFNPAGFGSVYRVESVYKSVSNTRPQCSSEILVFDNSNSLFAEYNIDTRLDLAGACSIHNSLQLDNGNADKTCIAGDIVALREKKSTHVAVMLWMKLYGGGPASGSNLVQIGRNDSQMLSLTAYNAGAAGVIVRCTVDDSSSGLPESFSASQTFTGSSFNGWIPLFCLFSAGSSYQNGITLSSLSHFAPYPLQSTLPAAGPAAINLPSDISIAGRYNSSENICSQPFNGEIADFRVYSYIDSSYLLDDYFKDISLYSRGLLDLNPTGLLLHYSFLPRHINFASQTIYDVTGQNNYDPSTKSAPIKVIRPNGRMQRIASRSFNPAFPFLSPTCEQLAMYPGTSSYSPSLAGAYSVPNLNQELGICTAHYSIRFDPRGSTATLNGYDGFPVFPWADTYGLSYTGSNDIGFTIAFWAKVNIYSLPSDGSVVLSLHSNDFAPNSTFRHFIVGFTANQFICTFNFPGYASSTYAHLHLPFNAANYFHLYVCKVEESLGGSGAVITTTIDDPEKSYVTVQGELANSEYSYTANGYFLNKTVNDVDFAAYITVGGALDWEQYYSSGTKPYKQPFVGEISDLNVFGSILMTNANIQSYYYGHSAWPQLDSNWNVSFHNVGKKILDWNTLILATPTIAPEATVTLLNFEAPLNQFNDAYFFLDAAQKMKDKTNSHSDYPLLYNPSIQSQLCSARSQCPPGVTTAGSSLSGQCNYNVADFASDSNNCGHTGNRCNVGKCIRGYCRTVGTCAIRNSIQLVNKGSWKGSSRLNTTDISPQTGLNGIYGSLKTKLPANQSLVILAWVKVDVATLLQTATIASIGTNKNLDTPSNATLLSFTISSRGLSCDFNNDHGPSIPSKFIYVQTQWIFVACAYQVTNDAASMAIYAEPTNDRDGTDSNNKASYPLPWYNSNSGSNFLGSSSENYITVGAELAWDTPWKDGNVPEFRSQFSGYIAELYLFTVGADTLQSVDSWVTGFADSFSPIGVDPYLHLSFARDYYIDWRNLAIIPAADSVLTDELKVMIDNSNGFFLNSEDTPAKATDGCLDNSVQTVSTSSCPFSGIPAIINSGSSDLGIFTQDYSATEAAYDGYVAISGNGRIIAGACTSNCASGRGVIHIYEKNSTEHWNAVAELWDTSAQPAPPVGASLGSSGLAVNYEGTLVAAATSTDCLGASCYGVRIWGKRAGGWPLGGFSNYSITSSDTAASFGSSLAMSYDGSIIAVGAPTDAAGSVYIFQFNSTTNSYIQRNKLQGTLYNNGYNSQQGSVLAMSANGAVVISATVLEGETSKGAIWYSLVT